VQPPHGELVMVIDRRVECPLGKLQEGIVRAPASFASSTLWPEFEELGDALSAHLFDISNRIIREEVYATNEGADGIPETALLR